MAPGLFALNEQDIMQIGGWLFYSNLHIGVVAVGLMVATGHLLAVSYPAVLILVGISGSILVYHLDHFWLTSKEDIQNQALRYRWQQNHAGYMRGSSVVLILVCGGSIVFLDGDVLVVGMILGVAGSLYGVRMLPGKERPKDLGAIKPFFITGVWALGSVIPVVVAAGTVDVGEVAGLVIYRFGYILPNLLVVDWLDREGDRDAGIHTVVSTWSDQRLQRIVGLIVVSTVIWGTVLERAAITNEWIYLDMIGLLVLTGCVWWKRAWQWRWYRGVLDVAVAWPLVLSMKPFIG